MGVSLTALGLVLGLPTEVHAQATCNGAIQISYPTVQVPNTLNSVDTVQVTIGAGSIDLGTQLTIGMINFGLTCPEPVPPVYGRCEQDLLQR